jgi:hypothetical protein
MRHFAGAVLVLMLLTACVGAGGNAPENVASRTPAVLGVRQAEEFSTLIEMAQSADAVLIGTVSSVTSGRLIDPGDAPPMQFLDVRVGVEQILGGEAGDALTIEVDPILFPDREQPTRVWPVAGQSYLLFLRLKGDLEAPAAYRLINTAGLFLIEPGGKLRPFDSSSPLAENVASLGLAGVQDQITSATE